MISVYQTTLSVFVFFTIASASWKHSALHKVFGKYLQNELVEDQRKEKFWRRELLPYPESSPTVVLVLRKKKKAHLIRESGFQKSPQRLPNIGSSVLSLRLFL